MMRRSRNDADDPDRDRRDGEDREPDIDTVVHGDGRTVAAHHHELAVRQVDDAHHPEHDGKPEADQRQSRDGIDKIDRNDDR
jgi:hypothetical protein